MMVDNKRYALISSFLALPKSKVEQRWLVEAIRSAKKSALEYMNDCEQDGASNFKSVSEHDPYVSESSFFIDYYAARSHFEYWLSLEEELYLSIGYEHCFDEEQSSKIKSRVEKIDHCRAPNSLLIKQIADNLMMYVSRESDLLESAKYDLKLANNNVKDYGPEDTTNFDDEWFRLQDELEVAEDYLRKLELILPLCWDSIKEFIETSRPRSYIPYHLLNFILENKREFFIDSYLAMEEQSTKIASGNHEVQFEDETINILHDCKSNNKFEKCKPEDHKVRKLDNFEDEIPF